MLKDLYAEIKSSPTILSYQQEVYFMAELMKADLSILCSNQNQFLDIIDQLHTSHMDTIFEVNVNNMKPYADFSVWLHSVKYLFPDDEKKLDIIAQDMKTLFF